MSPAEQGAADLKPDRQMIDPRSNQQLAGRMTDGTDYFSIADDPEIINKQALEGTFTWKKSLVMIKL
jgi:hypothetical protein